MYLKRLGGSKDIFQIQHKVPCMENIKRKLTELEAITKFSIHLISVSELKQDSVLQTANNSTEARSQKTWNTIIRNEGKEVSTNKSILFLVKNNVKFITSNKRDLKHIK